MMATTMGARVIVALMLLAIVSQCDRSHAQQRQLYDAAGRNAGRIVTDSAGNQTLYGADGRAVVRTSPDSSGSVYDATTGRRIGTTTPSRGFTPR